MSRTDPAQETHHVAGRGAKAATPAGRGMLLTGVVLVVLGVVLAVDRAGLLPADLSGLLATWWPLLLLVWGVRRLIRRRAGGWVLVAIGLIVLAATTGMVRMLADQDALGPVLLIGAGAAVLVGGLRRQAAGGPRGGTALFDDVRLHRDPSRDPADVLALFGDAELVIDATDPLAGGQVGAVAVFGDARVVVPQDVSVQLHEVAVFGDVKAPAQPAEPTGQLVVRATAVFGDVRIVRR